MLSPSNPADYQRFLKIKNLPRFSFSGRVASFPDEYASELGLTCKRSADAKYAPPSWMFDYQAAITKLAIAKRKFATFIDCGLGKTAILLEFARHAKKCLPKKSSVLIVSPLMVVEQTMGEAAKFYDGRYDMEQIAAADLPRWLSSGTGIGITNYEAITPNLSPGHLGCLILDESSMLKSMYGKWGQTLIRLGRGLEWKLCLTGTPAPNDRIEYGNHAVFLDQFPTLNAFLARYFVNRGQTDNRWEVKPHALHAFYRSLSHWCVFLTSPATYGWKDNAGSIPPIHVHVDDVPLTDVQREMVARHGGDLYGTPGGITSRSTLSQIAKGNAKGVAVDTNKPAFIRRMIESWPDESTLVWCLYNREQELLEKELPQAASIKGDTPHEERKRIIQDFKTGAVKILLSKPKILGFGLNLQIATRQVFSGLQDSFESYYQAVKRSNRIGSTRPLNVHIPVTDVERPMIETVLRKAGMVQKDTEMQEKLFKEAGLSCR